jgi:hypothetical protein
MWLISHLAIHHLQNVHAMLAVIDQDKMFALGERVPIYSSWRHHPIIPIGKASQKGPAPRSKVTTYVLEGGQHLMPRGSIAFPTLVLHFAAIEAHGRMVIEWAGVSMSASLIGRLGSSAFRPLPPPQCVDVTHGLVLLFGLGTKALASWDSKTRWNNLCRGLAVRRTTGPSGHANSPHPSSREGHHATTGWSSSFLLSHLILYSSHAVATSWGQRNSVPSTQMRCMITAKRRARATIAFFIPRRLAICIAQALSQDHLVERTSML